MTIRRSIAVVILLCSIGASTAAQGPTRKYIDGRSAADTAATPFSGAVLVGDTLYLSGQLGASANAKPETAEAEAKAVLDKVQATLVKAGMTMDDLVSVQIFCSDVANYAAFNGVYRTYFKKEFPARAFLGSGTLLFGARFEVMGIAVKR
jgi:reactive intermediate/imine deaminase